MVTPKKHSSAKNKLPGKEKVSVNREHGEALVGSKLKVWWPIDRKFYKGVVDSYDSTKKKHLIFYEDGDQEVLDMNKEKWELIDEDEDDAEADEIPLHDGSADESSDATPEALGKKRAKSNGNSSEKGRKDDAVAAVPKKKQKIASSAKSKSKGRSGKKLEDSEGEREKPKSGVKKAEKSKDAEKQTPKPATESNGKMGDVGGKIVAAASRMSGRFQNKNGLEKETLKSVKSSKKISESNNQKQKSPSSSSETVSEKVGEKDDDDTSDDDSMLIVSLLKTPDAIKAFLEKMRRKREREAGERSLGKEAEAEGEAEVEAEAEAEAAAEVEAEAGDEAKP